MLFHRTQAATILALERRRLRGGRSTPFAKGSTASTPTSSPGGTSTTRAESPNPALIDHLRGFEQEIRKNFASRRPCREQLDEAVAREDYEQAARLRDKIRAQTKAGR